MTSALAIWVLAGVGLVGTAIPCANSLLDRLIRREHDAHPTQWERDDRPIGPFFTPPQAKAFTSRWSFHACTFDWLLSSPTWIREDPTAAALLRRLRWTVLCGFIGLALLLGLLWRVAAGSVI